MVEGGVDVVEVGLPYSDPLMDGPVIQQAVQQIVRMGRHDAGAEELDVIQVFSVVGLNRREAAVLGDLSRYSTSEVLLPQFHSSRAIRRKIDRFSVTRPVRHTIFIFPLCHRVHVSAFGIDHVDRADLRP